MSTPTSRQQPTGRVLALLAVICVIGLAPLAYVLIVGPDESGSGGDDLGLAADDSLPPEMAGRPAPALRLTNFDGQPIDTRVLAGRPYLVTFLYTNCPDVCPLIGREIASALDMLGPEAREVQVVGVSVDPRGDTPEAVRRWLARNGLPAGVDYAIGSERELRPAWEAYLAAPQIPGDPRSSHTASIWLVDRAGRLRGRLSAGLPVPPEALAADLRELLGERG